MSPVDQYAAATTESLARLAVEQAARHAEERWLAFANSLSFPDEAAVRAENARGAFEALVRCVDELARRSVALEEERNRLIQHERVLAAEYVNGFDAGSRGEAQRAVEGERRL